MQHLYIDLDKTLLPFDSFPGFVMFFLPRLGSRAWPLLLKTPWLALPSNRPKIRPGIAKVLEDQETSSIELLCENWVNKNLVPKIRRNLIPQKIPFSICSMSLDLVTNPLAETLGGRSLGTKLERQQDKFTGNLDGPQCGGEGKAQIIREDAQSHGYDLKQCGLITDHHRDIPALEVVGHRFLLEPTQNLKQWGQNNLSIIVKAEDNFENLISSSTKSPKRNILEQTDLVSPLDEAWDADS